jgi:hypothetical protein
MIGGYKPAGRTSTQYWSGITIAGICNLRKVRAGDRPLVGQKSVRFLISFESRPEQLFARTDPAIDMPFTSGTRESNDITARKGHVPARSPDAVKCSAC